MTKYESESMMVGTKRVNDKKSLQGAKLPKSNHSVKAKKVPYDASTGTYMKKGGHAHKSKDGHKKHHSEHHAHKKHHAEHHMHDGHHGKEHMHEMMHGGHHKGHKKKALSKELMHEAYLHKELKKRKMMALGGAAKVRKGVATMKGAQRV